MKYGFLTGLLVVVLCLPALAQAQTVINCPNGFNSTPNAPCSAGGASGINGVIWLENATVLSGSQMVLNNGGSHIANNAWYTTPVNIQAFTTTFTFQANCAPSPTDCGNGFGFMIVGNNSTNPVCPPNGPSCAHYSDGASQSFSWDNGCSTSNPPDVNTGCLGIDLALLKFDLIQVNGPAGQNLTNYFQASGTPGNSLGGTWPHSASDLNMAPSGINIQSGDVMSVTLTYDDTNMYETVTDTSTNASFTHTYTTDSRGNAINLPALMGANTAFIGFGASNGAPKMDLNILTWTYTVNARGLTPTPTPTATQSASDFNIAPSGVDIHNGDILKPH